MPPGCYCLLLFGSYGAGHAWRGGYPLLPSTAGCDAVPAVQVMGVQTDNYVRLGKKGQQPGSWQGERYLRVRSLLMAPAPSPCLLECSDTICSLQSVC